jgi:hypothetical protein
MRTSLNGPVVLFGNDNPQQIADTDSGPNVDYQSNALLDSRYVSQVTAAGEGAQAGILAWHNPVEAEVLSAIPQAASNTVLAAAQAPAALAFFTLASANATGIAVNIPLIPFGQAIQPGAQGLVNVIALDFGFAIGTTTTAAATANVLTLTGPTPGGYTGTATYASRFFYPGQRILVPGAGNVAGTLPLSTVVLATDRYAAPGQVLAATGTVLMANPALAVATNVGIGTSDQEYGVAVKPVVKAGAIRVYDPAQMVARNVTLTAGSTTASGNAIVRGFDIYEQPMSEVIPIPTTATTNSGKKAFAYVSSVQVQAGGVTTGNVSVGTGTAIGIPVRVDLFENLAIFVNNVQIVGSAGSLPANLVTADQTPTATSSTGDVRGTYIPGTLNGTARTVIFHQAPIHQAKVSTNIDFRGLIGVVQA